MGRAWPPPCPAPAPYVHALGRQLARVENLVKGGAIAKPAWFDIMKQFPPPKLPYAGPRPKQIVFPEVPNPTHAPPPLRAQRPLPSPSEAQRPTHPRGGVSQDRLFKQYMKRNPDWEQEEIKMHRKAVAEGYKTRGYHFVNLWQKYIEAGLNQEDAYDKAPARPALSPAAGAQRRRLAARGGLLRAARRDPRRAGSTPPPPPSY